MLGAITFLMKNCEVENCLLLQKETFLILMSFRSNTIYFQSLILEVKGISFV